MTFAGTLLRGLVLASAVWAVLSLAFLWLRARAFGKRAFFAKPAGSALGGAVYAFTRGMLPWAKESVRQHLPSFLLGLALHLGVFLGLALLAMHLLGLSYPPLGGDAGAIVRVGISDDVTVSVRLVPLLLVLGVVGGASLFVKRLVNPTLRGLSCLDDYVSNLLVTLFVALALASVLLGRPATAFFISAIVLFLYLPLGKMRHCLFFFSTRYHFGAFFGRRGCMPPTTKNADPQRFGA
jgi:hypothetical protein